SRYLPDSESGERVVNTNPQPQYGLEVALDNRGTDVSAWVFADRTAKLGRQVVEFRVVPDAGELARQLATPPEKSPSGMGTVKIEVSGEVFEFPLELCMGGAVPIGDTGRTVRVSKYLPHATVVEGNKLISASSRPENPAIEAELTGPQGTEIRRAFAKFPDFATMHGGQTPDDTVKLTFVASGQSSPLAAPITVFLGPEEKLYARFASEGGGKAIGIGDTVVTPWPNSTFRVLQLLDHARVDVAVEPVDPPRETRIPALFVDLEAPDSTSSVWVQKYRSQPVTVHGRSLQLMYQDEVIPLGFTLELRKFRIGKYPGETRPRSFESHVTVTDPTTAREQSTVISMNNPSKFGGYSLFQSSYRRAGMGSPETLSILSVARDPGMPIVFVGYFGTMVGMLVLLGTRFSQRRRRSLALGGGQ
ncbi:MAG: cytochrome c biogenesis protein ResB, partial [Planctomycetes bacterium]|nr:cytochrome c biogenesis protein ResB [Planctomycetota bacterium]